MRRFITITVYTLIGLLLAGVVVDRIVVEGNVTIPASEILNVAGLKAGEDIFTLDIQIAGRKILDSGYFSKVDFDIGKDATAMVLRIKVVENPVVRDYIVDVEGPKLVDLSKQATIVTLEKGKALSLKKLRETMENIREAYYSAGYVLIDVQTNVHVTEDRVVVPGNTVKITIREFAIWDVEIEGDLPEEEIKYLRSLINVPLYKDYVSKTSLEKLFISEKSQYPKLVDIQKTRANLGKVYYIGPSSTFDLKVYDENKRLLLLKIRVIPPKIVDGIKRVDTVNIEGNRILETQNLLKKLSFEPGEYNNMSVAVLIDHLRRAYEEEGYVSVRFFPNVEEGKLNVRIEELPVVKIEIDGLNKTKKYLIEDSLKISMGKPLNLKEIAETYRNLHVLGYFEEINIIPSEEATGIKVSIRLKEDVKPRKFMFGGTWTPPENVKDPLDFAREIFNIKNWLGYFDFEVLNPFGYGQTFGVKLNAGIKSASGSLTYSVPRLFGSNINFSLSYSYEDSTTSDSTRVSESSVATVTTATRTQVWKIVPDISYRFTEKDRSGLNFTITRGKKITEIATYTGVSTLTTSTESPNNVVQIGIYFNHVDWDDPFYPMDGWYLYAGYWRAGLTPEDSFAFDKALLDLRVYLKLHEDLSWASRLKLGYMWNISGAPKYFSIGGPTSVRGFTDLLSGPAMYLLNTELRQKVISSGNNLDIYAVAFLDLGYAGKEFRYSDALRSFGIGMHLKIPVIGVFRFDLAYANEKWNWSFGFGVMF